MDFKELLQERELTCYEVAKKTGISHPYLKKLENGTIEWRQITYGKLEKIAKLLGLTVDDMVNLDHD